MECFFAVRSLIQQREASRAVSLFFVKTVFDAVFLLKIDLVVRPQNKFYSTAAAHAGNNFYRLRGRHAKPRSTDRNQPWSRGYISPSRNAIRALGGEKSNSASSWLDQQLFVSELQKRGVTSTVSGSYLPYVHEKKTFLALRPIGSVHRNFDSRKFLAESCRICFSFLATFCCHKNRCWQKME